MVKKKFSIGVIGDGGWGTTLAKLLAEKGHPVTIWSPFPEQVKTMQKTRVNKKFLPGVRIPSRVAFSEDLKVVVESNRYLVLAIPSQYLVSVLEKIKGYSYRSRAFISVVKGVDAKSFLTMTELVERELGQVPIAVLSGPTIAIEVAKGIPTTAVISSRDKMLMVDLQKLFSCDHFRVYTNADVMGVEISGSVKNIIALACGICDGLGFGTNTKAALLTRGLVEMTRLGRALKADPSTFTGLTGLGDLATTCFSLNSRNRHVGYELGRGKKINAILKGMNAVAEGVVTVKAVRSLAKKLKVDMPITEAVYSVIYLGRSPRKVVQDLMKRSLKSE